MFLGGWQIPPVTSNAVLRAVLEFVTFFVKAYGLALVAMWVRATLPRVRVVQLMAMCWKYFVPISFVNVIGVAVWVAVWPHGFPHSRLRATKFRCWSGIVLAPWNAVLT